MAVEPVVCGASERPPRSDCARGGQVRADHTCPQDYERYTEQDHDTFHGLFGNVPLIFNPVLVDSALRYDEGGHKAERLDACELLSRLYWYTIEFGG